MAQVAEKGVDPTIRRLVAENRELRGLSVLRKELDIDGLLASEDENDD